MYRFSNTLSSWIDNVAAGPRTGKQVVSVVADGVTAMLALWLAYTLRLGEPFTHWESTWHLFILVPGLTILVSTSLGVYRWVVRSTNFRLFRQITKATALASLGFLVLIFVFPPEQGHPRSVLFIFGLLQLLGAVSMRLIWQSMFDTGKTGEPVAIYGAGSSGRQLADSLMIGSEYRPVVFIDDSPALQQTTVSGISVISGSDISAIKHKLSALEVGRLVLAMPSLSKAEYRNRLEHVKALNLPVQTVPSVVEIVTGLEKVDQIRDVSIKDILGRSEVSPDAEAVSRSVANKTVLVTGGGGSIGSELCRQILHLGAIHLIALDHSEENLYKITEEFNRSSVSDKNADEPIAEFTAILGSVRDSSRMKQLFEDFDIDTVFHAAAYKHVPIIERQPQQGVETNVFGTKVLIESAIDAGVSNFTLISTDKAVRPTNAMGASKRVAELILQAKAREEHNTLISMVRFGNVLGSSGSVVPKFKEQIRSGGPITITHPDITRYFMTIPEAAQLVLQASAVAKGGDVFVLDMGEPVKILDLAKTMVALSGSQLQENTGDPEDIDITFEGLRPGEKMFEELFITNNKPTEIQKVFSADENWLLWEDLLGSLEELEMLMRENNDAKIRAKLLELAFIDSEESQCVNDTHKKDVLNSGQKTNNYVDVDQPLAEGSTATHEPEKVI